MTSQDDLIRALSMTSTAIDNPFVVCWRDLDDATTTEELSALRTFWESCYLEDAAPSDPSPSTAT
ncbi:hypothetical protein [Kribbella sp. NPDC051718]|uniref:hypothetical protein n=1 Tax=Kribbella sp. NPDC051718 TaxID=3155168 RepID=UPI0034272F6C